MNQRRRVLGAAAAGALGLGALGLRPCTATAQSTTPIRFAASSIDTAQCILPIGIDAGVFARAGIDLRVAAWPAGPAEAVTGLLDGRWEFAHVGLVPLARQTLEGHDVVLIATPVESHRTGLLVARQDIRSPEQLSGASVGVVSESGESGTVAKAILDSLAVFGRLMPLGSVREVARALQEGRVDAAYLPLEQAYAGRRRYNWTSFEGGAAAIPGGIATTRSLIRRNPALVEAVTKGCVASIHLFKTNARVAQSMLQKHLQLDSSDTARDLWEFHAPLLRPLPRPTLFSALGGLRAALASRYANAAGLQADSVIDASFINRLEQDGVIRSLYGNA